MLVVFILPVALLARLPKSKSAHTVALPLKIRMKAAVPVASAALSSTMGLKVMSPPLCVALGSELPVTVPNFV